MSNLQSTPEYATWLKEIKERISRAQIRTALAASRELIFFYWELGDEYSATFSLSEKIIHRSGGQNEIVPQPGAQTIPTTITLGELYKKATYKEYLHVQSLRQALLI